MNWEIEAFESVGPIRFGTPRNEVRKQLGSAFTSFAKDAGENETDAYDEMGVHLYYDDDDRLEMIEAFEPALIAIGGVALLGRGHQDVEDELEKFGYTGRPTDVGCLYPNLGVSLTLADGVVEGVAAARRGYFEG